MVTSACHTPSLPPPAFGLPLSTPQQIFGFEVFHPPLSSAPKPEWSGVLRESALSHAASPILPLSRSASTTREVSGSVALNSPTFKPQEAVQCWPDSLFQSGMATSPSTSYPPPIQTCKNRGNCPSIAGDRVSGQHPAIPDCKPGPIRTLSFPPVPSPHLCPEASHARLIGHPTPPFLSGNTFYTSDLQTRTNAGRMSSW